MNLSLPTSTQNSTRITIDRLNERDLIIGAELLATRHRTDRRRDGRLPDTLEDPEDALGRLSEIYHSDGAIPVAARRGDALIGYVIGVPDRVPPTSWESPFTRPSTMNVPYLGHAVRAEREEEHEDIYRALYAASAGVWTQAGYDTHYVSLPAKDWEARSVWSHFGFFPAMTLATRPTRRAVIGHRSREVSIRRAGRADVPTVLAFAEDLFRSLSDSPTLLPVPVSVMPDLREHQEALLADPACPHWLAIRGGRPIGMHVVIEPQSPQWFLSNATCRDDCAYLFEAYVAPEERGAGVGNALLDSTLSWMHDAGYSHCALHHLPGAFAASHWRRNEFAALETRLCRRIDTRAP